MFIFPPFSERRSAEKNIVRDVYETLQSFQRIIPQQNFSPVTAQRTFYTFTIMLDSHLKHKEDLIEEQVF